MYSQVQMAIAVLLLASFKVLFWSPAIASPVQPSSTWVHTTYSNGVTTLSVIENAEGGYHSSTYQTMINGKIVIGSFGLDRIRQDKTYTYLSGRFLDTCTGQINIRRPNRQSGLPIVAEVTWVVTRQPVNVRSIKPPNQNCETPNGQTFQLKLPEALPKADQQGEFTNTNSTTFFADGEFSTWTQWQVVSADGVLNCREQPDGRVQQTYRQGQIIGKMGRENKNLVEMPKGRFWLKTQERCYVRANERLLKPVSLPINRWLKSVSTSGGESGSGSVNRSALVTSNTMVFQPSQSKLSGLKT